MNNDNILLFLIIFIAVFLVLREFNTWYWKQNKIVSLLESINSHLEKLTDQIPDSEDSEDEEKIKG